MNRSNSIDSNSMILAKGEKVHIIHRRSLEHEPHRHFVGEVDDYQAGVARVSGYLFTVDREIGGYVRRPDKRIRIISIVAGDTFVNVIPSSVNLETITYQQEKKVMRVSDGSGWHLDISEVSWL
jgi:hypothetical protein